MQIIVRKGETILKLTKGEQTKLSNAMDLLVSIHDHSKGVIHENSSTAADAISDVLDAIARSQEKLPLFDKSSGESSSSSDKAAT